MFKRITVAARNHSTYRLGVLQDKAYRIMKKEVGAALAPYDITTTEWAFLGLLYDEVVRYPSEAAQELGVEAAFITMISRKFKERELLSEEKDTDDSRKRCIRITKKGKEFVASTENAIRGGLAQLVSGASARELTDYLLLLQRVIENSKGN